MNSNSEQTASRMNQLKQIAETYFESLRNRTFDTIPFDENASLRAPLTPGGSDVPLSGKEAIQRDWWIPLELALKGVRINILGHYFHENLHGIITEAEVTLATPNVTLRVADRFTVNENGKITEQENHFDPRAVTGG